MHKWFELKVNAENKYFLNTIMTIICLFITCNIPSYSKETMVFFSCDISNNSHIILYGEGNSKNSISDVRYLFEHNGEVEFLYPDVADDTLFTYVKYFRYQTEYFRVFFENKHFEYMLYRNHHGDEISGNRTSTGIIITNTQTNHDSEISCINIEIDNLQKIEDIISMDERGRL